MNTQEKTVDLETPLSDETLDHIAGGGNGHQAPKEDAGPAGGHQMTDHLGPEEILPATFR